MPRRCGSSPTARCLSPTGRTPRPRSTWAVFGYWKPPIWMRHSHGLRRAPSPATYRARCASFFSSRLQNQDPAEASKQPGAPRRWAFEERAVQPHRRVRRRQRFDGRNQMRKLIYAINITVDGRCDHTKQFVDEETLEYFTHLTREADLQVFGRKTYQLMVPYWPEVLKNQSATKADTEFARAFDSTNKIVFS